MVVEPFAVIVGIVGTFTVTTTDEDVVEQPFAFVTVTAYVPEVLIETL
jgi:hypothetical protein